MRFIYLPDFLTGKTCGFVSFRDGEQQLQPYEKASLADAAYKMVQRGKDRQCSIFLVALCDESNIFIARILLHLRKRNPSIRIVVMAPSDETMLHKSLTDRVMAANMEAQADDVLFRNVPVEDLPLQVAMHSDHLIAFDFDNADALHEFMNDIFAIDCACTVEKWSK